MKKTIALLLGAALLATAAVPALAGDALIAPLISQDTQKLDLTGREAYLENGRVMVPLRMVAEALGYTVTWDGEQSRVDLDNGVSHTYVTLGVDSYCKISSTAIGMSAPQSFGAAPVSIDGSSFVPIDLFALLGDTVVTSDGAATITSGERNVCFEIPNQSTQIPNPIEGFDTVEPAMAAAGLDIELPKLPQDYKMEAASVIGGTLFQVAYRSGDDAVTFRAALGDEDISGDYNVYSELKAVEVNGVKVELKGDGGVVNLAKWCEDGVSYSLSSEKGLSAQTVLEIIRDI
ncbi:copper amine oxidase N-terminal domain-containing protein [Feifania hominis]|uniref:Copper amine oxidase N-terminal domain-containing protein n=1 Tax=Feifania hominis TaxID=2763660 RepID=A0A926DCE4_9FIRM|nr:copper amine oxidase N-terminal domain-containing protein [Feifania hominis]MBC8535272.1 copper amine oxidase N-terminal domain-containing protein [Feifania hominis]